MAPPPPAPLSGWQAAAFGPRAAGLRVAAALAALAAVLAWAEVRWDPPGRDIVHCLRRPAEHHGATVWLGPARVEALETGGFASRDAGEDLVHVRNADGLVREKDQVVFRGTFHRDGYVTLDWEDRRPVLRFSRAGQEKRIWMFIVSFGVLGYVAWRARRTFRWRDGAIELRPQ